MDTRSQIRTFFAQYDPPAGSAGLTARMVGHTLGLPPGIAGPELDQLARAGELVAVKTTVHGPTRYRSVRPLRQAG